MSSMKAGITPVIAAITLITIAVITIVTTWYWVSSYTLKPAIAESTLKGYTITGVYKNASKTGCSSIDIKNTGGTSLSGVLFYIKDYASGKPVGRNGTNPTYPAVVNISSITPGNTSRVDISDYGSVSFTETIIDDLPSDGLAVVIGDANNDGKNDIVLSASQVGCCKMIKLYENKTGTWVKSNITGTLPADAYGLALGDSNNNGKMDVSIGIYSAINETRMYENISGGWVETNISNSTQLVYSVAVGDANNDGKNEIVIGVYETTNELRMYENKTGKWVESNISDFNSDVHSVKIGDADNDGKNEIVAGSSAEGAVRMYKNVSNTWVETNISDSFDWNYGNVEGLDIGDVDNDGKNEVVIGMDAFNYRLRMYKNTSGRWVETNITNIAAAIFSVSIGDADNDGSNEIVIGSDASPYPIRMYKYRGGSWVETNISDVSSYAFVAVGDANNDGQKEIAASFGSITNEVRMYTSNPATISIPLGTYVLRTNTPGFTDQIFTCA